MHVSHTTPLKNSTGIESHITYVIHNNVFNEKFTDLI